MILSHKKSILLSLIPGFRLGSSEGFHSSRFLKEKNYYDVLKVDQKCDAKEIRDSFINLAKKYHPDTNQNDPKSHARFVELQKAYSVLGSPSKRRDYDLGLHDVSTFYNQPYRKPKGENKDFRAYEDYFNEEYRELFYRSRMKPNANTPRLRVGVLRITLLFIAFTTVGALIQFFVIKWLYKRNYDDEMARHHRGAAAFYALKDAMDKQQEEFNIHKLRTAYYKEVGEGNIGLHLVPMLIRPKLPHQPESTNSQKGNSSKNPEETGDIKR
ncbi:DnaJ-like protein subfamily A member 3, mitochondrial [Frankliniella fusca]|uniref:DnaJ-like protein subfamily A member 3, mitochondrial n=1 Tax=Frankliniella fusca TaxID=407009 RepID=A0AAE1H063_9NEOP|nr:DnaJ-like protein subfamily A member 3, mitochondrial [Frankliniella fusca]